MADFRLSRQKDLLKPLRLAVEGGVLPTSGADRLKSLVCGMNGSDLVGPPAEPKMLRDTLLDNVGAMGALQAKLKFEQEMFPHGDGAVVIAAELMLAIAALV